MKLTIKTYFVLAFLFLVGLFLVVTNRLKGQVSHFP
jgi:hypothetical protein